MRVVEFAGTFCAGKMWLLASVKEQLRSYTVETIARDLVIASEMAHPTDYLARQILLTNDVTNQLIKFRDLRMPNLLVLVHRGLYDTLAFLSAYVKAGVIPQTRASPQLAAFRANAELLTDLVVLVKTPVEIAFRRAKSKFSGFFQLEKPDIVFTKEFFEVLDQAYAELEQNLPPNSIIIDGTEKVEKNVNKILIEGIDPVLVQAELKQKEEGSTWREGNRKVKRQRQTINNANATLA